LFSTLVDQRTGGVRPYHAGNTAAVAGVYPAITLSSFKPLEAMKGKLSGIGNKGNFRKVLVVVQFSFSILLITSTIIIGKQLKYIREKNLGYDKENVFSFWMRDINGHYDAAVAELLKQPGHIRRYGIRRGHHQ